MSSKNAIPLCQYAWYIAHVNSGSEQTVKNAIINENNEHIISKDIFYKDDITLFNPDLNGKSIFKDVIVPSMQEKIINNHKEEKKLQKCVVPGYIFVNMIMSVYSYSLIIKIPKVIGFLGGKSPAKVSQKEIDQVLNTITKNEQEINSNLTISIGDEVEILDGSLTSMNGMITSIDAKNATATVAVSIFGKTTSINLPINSIKKA